MNRRQALKGLGLSVGYAVAAPTIIGVLQSCSEKGETWTTVFLREDEKEMVSYLVDIILPTTDTPGGADVNLPQFVDLMCNDTLISSDQEFFHQGSALFSEAYKEKFGRIIKKGNKDEVQQLFASYFDVSKAEQDQVKMLQSKRFEDLEESERNNYKLYKFLLTVRELSLIGYFSSEKIGTEVLSFDPIPGPYKPCIPVSEVGNAWSIIH